MIKILEKVLEISYVINYIFVVIAVFVLCYTFFNPILGYEIGKILAIVYIVDVVISSLITWVLNRLYIKGAKNE